MTDEERNALRLLGELLVQIRGIAGDASGAGHVSAAGRRFDPTHACKAIYALADAAHNLPDLVANGTREPMAFLWNGSLERISAAGAELFGDRSPFDYYVPRQE